MFRFICHHESVYFIVTSSKRNLPCRVGLLGGTSGDLCGISVNYMCSTRTANLHNFEHGSDLISTCNSICTIHCEMGGVLHRNRYEASTCLHSCAASFFVSRIGRTVRVSFQLDPSTKHCAESHRRNQPCQQDCNSK